jgi:hypothetical protein
MRFVGYMTRCQLAIRGLDRLAGPPRAANDRSNDAHAAGLIESLDELKRDAQELASRDRQTARRGLKADDARPRYATPLHAITQTYAFRADDGGTALTAAILIPGERFTPTTTNGTTVYPLTLSLIVADSATGRIERVDDSPAFRADQRVGAGKWFRATLDLDAVPKEDATWMIVVENAAKSSEGDMRSGTRNIPSFAGSDLMLSDLVVGEPGSGRWNRGPVAINPIPSHQVEAGHDFKLFYEIYNLAAGSSYRTSIHIAPKESGGIGGIIKSLIGRKQTVQLSFDGVAEQPSKIYGLQQVRTIGADLEHGEYELTVTITDLASGRQAVRTSSLVVLGEKDLSQ